jgi:hypothetical protein
MKIAVTNKMNQWFIDSFFNVDTLFLSTPKEIIDGLEKNKPDVLIFGDFKNSFNDFELGELLEIIKRNNINTLFYGGWQGFGLGNYESSFFDEDMSLKFRADESQMVIYKISAASENDIFSFPFDDCPEIAFYNKVDILTNNYKVVLNWNDGKTSHPLLLSKVSDCRKQLILLTTFTPPGGAKRLVLWNKYPTLWKEMLEWLGAEIIDYKKNENNVLVTLLSNYWNEQLTHEYATQVLATEMNSFEEELLLLMRDMFESLNDWEMSSIIGKKYYQYNRKKHGDTIPTLKSLAEQNKIEAYYHIAQNNYIEASNDFKNGGKVWNEIAKKNHSLVVAKGFCFYYSGLSSLYLTLNYLNSSPRKAKDYLGKALHLFECAVDLNGHSYSIVMLKLCKLIEIVLTHIIAKANIVKSFLTDVFFLSNYKKAIIELQYLLKEYSASIKYDHPPFTIDLALIEKQDYKWHFEVGLINYEQFTILNTISVILRDELFKFKKTISRNLTEATNIDKLINNVVEKTSKGTNETKQNIYNIYGDVIIKKTNIQTIDANQVNLIESLSEEGVILSAKEKETIQNDLIIIRECSKEEKEATSLAYEEIIGIVEKKLKDKSFTPNNDAINMMNIKKIISNQVNVIKGDNLQINNNMGKKTSHKKTNFWSSGLLIMAFYLVVVLSVVVFKILDISYLWFPLVIIGTIFFFTLSGAFALRDSEKLSQKNFLELMVIVFKKLIVVGLFSKDNEKNQENNEKMY